nr:uncharacterized protein LOC117855908 [Setaria viridis]
MAPALLLCLAYLPGSRKPLTEEKRRGWQSNVACPLFFMQVILFVSSEDTQMGSSSSTFSFPFRSNLKLSFLRAGRERDADAVAVAVAAAKAQAAREVCAASAVFAARQHRRRSPRGAGSRPHFVDWYLVLAIGEAASEDAVRRRYRQLGKARGGAAAMALNWLELHPDKNRLPKAEVAFKIVSE